MEFFRSLKKDVTKGDPLGPPTATEEPAADVPELVARLGSLGTMLAQVNEQVLAHLARQEAPAGSTALPDDTLKNFLQLLRQKLDDLAHDDHQLAESINRLEQNLDSRLKELVAAASTLKPSNTPISAPPAANWQQAILGPELTTAPSLEPHRQRLFEGLLSGKPAACALAGQLLLFQAATAERMAPLLKDIGEAYYRWQPKNSSASSPMELALVQWLKRRCEQGGIANQIELVSPGERFDALRHNAAARGVEVTEVYGWVVVRDNGKVYTKASVAVK